MALVAFLLILLPILAVLQYRWIGEVSTAERTRLESSLRMASERLSSDFAGEIGRLASVFQLRDGFPADASSILERHTAWAETAAFPQMLRAAYLLKVHPDREPDQFRVDFQTGELRPMALQSNALSALRDRMRPGPGALSLTWTPGTLTLIIPIVRPPRLFERPFELGAARRGSGPASATGQRNGLAPGGPFEGVSIVELDRDVFLKELVPSLAQKHFSAHDDAAYRMALLNTADSGRVLYSSEGAWSPEDISTPDAALNIFAGPPGAERRGGRGRASGPGPMPFLTPMRSDAGEGSIAGQRWMLLVKHRAGSLEKAVEQVRLRNLAISFGILLVLGAGVVSVFVLSHRARTLGRLQMEFAAGVSHELRTPLAVIRSAAHNLRTGIVRDKEGVEQYATIVQDEARRLSDMVDQVLLYSETQSGRRKYELSAVDITDVVDRALANLSPAVDLDQCEIATDIDDPLQLVNADATALAQCLQNLLSNAYKYGALGGKANITIEAKNDPGTHQVRLSVVDQGPGIDPADRRHLFEPFYRGVRAGSNVPGNGLGLHLVQRIMQAQGGQVTFSPGPEHGARFTLHIPAAT